MEEISLFQTSVVQQPLAARLRPRTIDDIIGQRHILGENRILRRLIEHDTVPSMIFGGRQGLERQRSPVS